MLARCADLPWPGGAKVAVGNVVRGPPDRHGRRGGVRHLATSECLCPVRRGVGGPGPGLLGDLAGEIGHPVCADCQVGAPVEVVGQAGGDGGQPGEGAGAQPGVEPRVEDGRRVRGVAEPAGREAAARSRATGSCPSRVRSARWERSVGQAGQSVRPSTRVSAASSSAPHGGLPEDLFGAEGDGVEVAGGGVAQLGHGAGVFAQGGGGRDGRGVAGQDLGELVERGRGDQGLGADHAVRVAVGADREVEVVGVAAAGGGHVELGAVLLAGEDGVRGVDGDALGAVDGGGVAELHVPVGDVVGGQADRAAQLCRGWR